MEPIIAALVREVEMVPLYFTLPGNFWHLIPSWVGEPKFENTSKEGRTKAERSELLFQGNTINMSRILGDLAVIDFHPAEIFYLNRETGTKRMRITCRPGGKPLSDEQMADLELLLSGHTWDVEAYRTSPTRFLPEHISIAAARPFESPGGGFEAVRVRNGLVCLGSPLDEEQVEAARRSIKGSLKDL